MGTSGREARGSRVGALVAAAAAVALATAATIAAQSLPRDSLRTYGGWCEAHARSAWAGVLSQHVVGLSRTTSLIPIALGHDGRSFFASVYSSSFSGVARIDAATSAVTEIRSFPDPDEDQALGAFDGRWLVWKEGHDYSDPDDFTIWEWDSQTGEAAQIGAATPAADGSYWPSPLNQPDVRGGIATWAQGAGADGLTTVHVYDLRAGRDSVVRTGHTAAPLLLPHHVVVWPESFRRGSYTRMSAASTLTGAPVATPLSLRTVRGVSDLATDGSRIAYPNAPYRSLWWSPSLRAPAREVVATRDFEAIDDSVQVNSRYIGFGVQPRLFVADTTTRRFLQIGARGGWSLLDRTTLLVTYGGKRKVLHPLLRVELVPLRDLPPIPPCS